MSIFDSSDNYIPEYNSIFSDSDYDQFNNSKEFMYDPEHLSPIFHSPNNSEQRDEVSLLEQENINILEKSPNNPEENLTKKKTSDSSENPSVVNQVPENKNGEILINIQNSENSSNSAEPEQKNSKKINLENNEFISHEEIRKKYEKDLNLEKLGNNSNGEMKNTRDIEKKLNKSEKKEKENLVGNKRKKSFKDEEDKKNKNIKKGRKKNGDSPGKHTKMSADNIMFTIRTHLDNWALNRINKHLPDKKLLKIDFKKFSKIINSKENIKYLETELGEIFSQDISPIYSKIAVDIGKDYNKKIIEEIMKSDDEKFKDAKKLLKLTYKEALDLYRFKEKETNLETILGNEIIGNLEGRVDEFLCKTFEKEKGKMGDSEAYDFVSSILVMAYNYERWFLLKNPKKRREKNRE